MEKLSYGLSSSDFTKLLSQPMQAPLDERRRLMPPKSFIFVLMALVAVVFLGVFLFPQTGHAQEECVWNCDLGSDINDFPWGNSPQSQLDIGYCIDPDCVIQNLTPILGPIPSANTNVSMTKTTLAPSSTCTNGGNSDVTVSGPVVAWLKDASGNVVAESPAQAFLSITIKCVIFGGNTGATTLKRAVAPKESPTNVFDASSSITILASSTTPSLNRPKGWTGCPSNNQGLTDNCVFPLGIVEFNNNNAIADALPQAGFFATGEVFHAEESNRFVGVRDCKGTPNGLPSTIACSNGEILTGGNSLALLFFPGNWSGAKAHTFNPKSGSNPYDIDISSDPSVIILPGTVVASANGGNPVFPTGCNNMPSKNVERCFFIAKDFNIVCKTGDQVNLLVTGQLQDGRKFQSTDLQLTCSNK